MKNSITTPARSLHNLMLCILTSFALVSGANLVFSSVTHAVSLNQIAPDFTLASSSKQNIRLAELRGQVVMINFWATWCNPCRVEIPQLQKIYTKYKNVGFTVLGVNIDKNKIQAKKMARKLGASFPILFDNNQQVSKLYSIKAMPLTVLIDRDGKIRSIFQGYKPGYEKKYASEIRKLLRE